MTIKDKNNLIQYNFKTFNNCTYSEFYMEITHHIYLNKLIWPNFWVRLALTVFLFIHAYQCNLNMSWGSLVYLNRLWGVIFPSMTNLSFWILEADSLNHCKNILWRDSLLFLKNNTLIHSALWYFHSF